MIWTIIGLLILASIGYVIKLGMIKTAADTANYVSAKHKVNKINRDPNNLQQEWETRVKQLNIDLSKAIFPKYYQEYYNNKSTAEYSYLYLWPAEGAIGGFPSLKQYDKNGNVVKFASSPLTWNIHYMELKDIRGIYRRNDVCLIQFDDTSCTTCFIHFSKGYALDH